MGCGKTPVVAHLGCSLAGPKLYLCPASLKAQVARELKRWGSPDTGVQILYGRQAKLQPDPDLHPRSQVMVACSSIRSPTLQCPRSRRPGPSSPALYFGSLITPWTERPHD
jgi:hypothetical protein